MPASDELQSYYDRRAAVYEEIYRRDDPVRQAELKTIGRYFREHLAGRHVLEIACGTGFWSAVIAEVAARLMGVDGSREMLAIAESKRLPAQKVAFTLGDAFALDQIPGEFDACLAVFWLSHVPKARVRTFLDGLHMRVGTGAVVAMADNVFNDGLGGDIVRPKGSEDTYKLRDLPDGSRHRIVKNYYGEDGLRGIFEPHAEDLDVNVGRCYWWVSYRVRGVQGDRVRGASSRLGQRSS